MAIAPRYLWDSLGINEPGENRLKYRDHVLADLDHCVCPVDDLSWKYKVAQLLNPAFRPYPFNYTLWTRRSVTYLSLTVPDLTIAAQALPAYPSLATVEQLILHEKRGNCVPVFVELPADQLTPCMAYLRIAKDSKYSFLLESVIGGENVARYSFIGAGESFRHLLTR